MTDYKMAKYCCFLIQCVFTVWTAWSSIEARPSSGEGVSILIRPPQPDNVTHVTAPNQYQKLFPNNGHYQFGYQTEDQFRVEERLGNGQLKGVFASRDENGTISAYSYGFDGFKYKQEPFKLEQIPDNLKLSEKLERLSMDQISSIKAIFGDNFQ